MNFQKSNTENKQFYLEKIENRLVLKKLFLKSDLTLANLAEETGIHLNYLSYLINSEMNCHFRDYLNLKRIGYFKEKINDLEWKDLTIEAMTKACGFKSRATCHRAFLKHVGVSPSEYLRSHRIEYNHRRVAKARYNYNRL